MIKKQAGMKNIPNINGTNQAVQGAPMAPSSMSMQSFAPTSSGAPLGGGGDYMPDPGAGTNPEQPGGLSIGDITTGSGDKKYNYQIMEAALGPRMLGLWMSQQGLSIDDFTNLPQRPPMDARMKDGGTFGEWLKDKYGDGSDTPTGIPPFFPLTF